MTFRHMAMLMSTTTVAFAAAEPAYAQVQEEQPAPQDDQSAADADDTEIVITAQKREERILDIPQSVTVVGGDTIERQQATTFQQYINEIPGLSVNESEPGETRLTLRGVNTGGVSSTVAVYVDEMPFGSSSALVNGAILTGDIDPFDLARIEVLRGPQGTLYGANSLGGIFKYVTNTPKIGELSVRARAGLEFVDEGGTGYNANGVVNAPLNDVAALRVTGFYRKRAGWIDANPQDVNFAGAFGGSVDATSVDDRNYNDNKSYGGRGSVLIRPSDPLTIRLTAFVQNLRTNGSSSVDFDPEEYEELNGDYGQTVFLPESSRIKYRIYNGVVDYDFGFASLVSATSYGRLATSFRTDATLALAGVINAIVGPLSPFPGGLPPGVIGPFPFPAQVTTDPLGVAQDQSTGLKKFTQELRLSSPSNDTLEWLVGGYYTNEKGLIDQHINGVVLDAPGTLENELTDLIFARVDSRYRELAAFTNVTWHLSGRFDITGGARLSRNKQRAEQVVGGPIAPIQFGGAIPIFEPGRSKETVFTYSLSPRFELNDNTAVYARVAKGYRPGGPNAVPPLTGDALAAFPTTFDADTLTSYEAGLKTDIGRRLSLDVAAYHLRWKDIQLFGSANNFGFNDNGEGARVNGAEGTLRYRPVRGLNLSLNAALIDAELTDDTPGLVGGENGDTLPYTPKFSFGANGDYEWPLAAGATGFVGASVRYTGKQRAGFRSEPAVVGGEVVFVPLPQRRIRDYTTLDLRAGAEFRGFTLEAFARNLTNSKGVTSLDEAEGIPGGGISAAFIQPRTIGFTLGTEF